MTDLDTRADDVPAEPDHNAYLGNDPFIDDDSWAEPRPSADRRLVSAAIILGLVLLATGGFIAGAKVQKSRASSSAANPFAALAARGGFGGFGRNGTGTTGTGGATGLAANDPLAALLGGGAGGSSAADTGSAAGAAPISGRVTKVDGSTITVTKDDGTVITVSLAPGASIGRRTTIGAEAVSVGDSISVTGTEASGAVTASAVTVGDLEIPSAAASPSSPTTTAPADLGGLLPG